MCDEKHVREGETVDMMNARPMRALGRQFALGELYDSRREESIEMFLWSPKTIQSKTKEEDTMGTELKIVGGEGRTGKMESFGLDAEMRVGILAGLVSVGGSGGYQVASALCAQTSATVVTYTAEKKMHRLHIEPEDQQEMQSAKSLKATHVVTRILYGVEVIFAFASDLTETQVEKLIEGKTDLKGRDPSTGLGVQGSAEATKETTESLKFELNGSWFCGDIPIDSVPTNTTEAIKFLKKLPGKTVP